MLWPVLETRRIRSRRYDRSCVMTSSASEIRTPKVMTRHKNPDSEKWLMLWPLQLYDQNTAIDTDGHDLWPRPTSAWTFAMTVLKNRYGRRSLKIKTHSINEQKPNFEATKYLNFVLCRLIMFGMIVPFQKSRVYNFWFWGASILKWAARPRSRTSSSSRGRARPRFGKSQLLAQIFGSRSTPTYEMDGTCPRHS